MDPPLECGHLGYHCALGYGIGLERRIFIFQDKPFLTQKGGTKKKKTQDVIVIFMLIHHWATEPIVNKLWTYSPVSSIEVS